MRRRVLRVIHLLVGAILTSGLVTRLHRAVYRRSRGGLLGSGLGLPMVLLTSTGRRSGRPRTVPLTGFLDGLDVVVVASNGGRHLDPSWLGNLRAEPRAHVQVGSRTWAVLAREASADEAARLWPIVIGGFGGYGTYRSRTERQIPLVILSPVESSAGSPVESLEGSPTETPEGSPVGSPGASPAETEA
jgi:deazaflavin-dependent oxidoreductase (nitroreductase family)